MNPTPPLLVDPLDSRGHMLDTAVVAKVILAGGEEHGVKDKDHEPKKKKRKDTELKPKDKRTAKEKIDDLLAELGDEYSREGLTSHEAESRRMTYGPNELPKAKQNLTLKFLAFFCNPLVCMMAFAALMSFIFVDFIGGVLISCLLVLNACIDIWQDYISSLNAIAALQYQLAPTCYCIRDGEMESIASADLVPGDVVLLRLGDVVPADCYLLDEGDYLTIDEAALTGESLPVKKFAGDEAFAGSNIKQGEMKAIVHATGLNTFFGRAAVLVSQPKAKKSHIHFVMKSISYFCAFLVIVGVVVELITQFGIRGKPCTNVIDAKCAPLNNMLVLIVGGLPVAMPAILSLTMAIGASALRKRGAIVTRLTAVEEIAGMEILCCDKTGTLTKNRLAAYNPVAYVGDADDVIFNAALCSIPDNGDAVDAAVIEFCTEAQQEHLQEMQVLDFKPFDPVSKRTQAKLQSPDGEVFYTTKGAPRVILGMCKNKDELIGKVIHDIETLGASGYRTLGVAVGDKTGTKWTMTGLIPLFDPPRKGTKAAIAKAEDDLGVHVKMITGDHLQIAKDTAKLLGMGTNVLPGQSLRYEQKWAEISREAIAELIKSADGFAQVFPEDKYEVVRIHRDEGQYIVGVTGDGGGDAPVLQKANIGIAVYGATDAARAASDIVLTKNGISVIVDAIVEGRQIFQRMKNYCIYSISMNVRTVLTFAILTLAYDFYFPVIAIVLLIFLNDCCVVTICKDRVKSSKTPDKWNLSEIVGTAIAIGIYLTISTVVLFELAVNSDAFHQWFGLPQRSYAEARGLLYLQMSLSGFATQFVTRTHGFSWMIWRERPSIPVIISFVCGQFFASILCAYGLGGFPLDGQFDFRGAGWSFVVVVWIWVIFWYLLMYIIKFLMKAILRGGMVTVHHHKFGSNMHPFHFGQHSTGKGNE